jgi:hypothetical protein
MILFSFCSAANVYSKLLKDNGYGDLGFYGLAILYLVFSATCFFAPSVATLMRP